MASRNGERVSYERSIGGAPEDLLRRGRVEEPLIRLAHPVAAEHAPRGGGEAEACMTRVVPRPMAAHP